MQSSRVVLIILARQGSSRLPGKALADVVGKPMIAHIIERARKADGIDDVIVATTGNPEDEPLLAAARAAGAQAFAGSTEDVLDRTYQAARAFNASAVVHIGGDCPFADPQIVERALTIYFAQRLDYVSNTLVQTFPSGMDVQVFSRSALARSWEEARMPTDRRHLSSYIHRHREKFHVQTFENGVNLAAMRWTLDYPEDLAFVREVYRHLYREGEIFHQRDILRLLEERPEITAINQAKALMLEERSASWDSEGYVADLHNDLLASAEKAVAADRQKNLIEAEKCYSEAAAIAEELSKRARALSGRSGG
jgi:spore coat polysaccharide biosynthesis protein SpsF